MSDVRKPYVTIEQHQQFIKWYLKNYGYNTHLKDNNSRVLSEAYKRDTNIEIPKVTIYRWLKKLGHNTVMSFASEYIVESLR